VTSYNLQQTNFLSETNFTQLIILKQYNSELTAPMLHIGPFGYTALFECKTCGTIRIETEIAIHGFKMSNVHCWKHVKKYANFTI
jgi:hypothetical protein